MSHEGGRRMRAAAPAAALALLLHAGPAWCAAETEARLSRSVMMLGESVTLEVVVRGVSGTVTPPEFELPAGIEILSSGKAQNYSWVNGRSIAEIVFRYELGASAAGRFQLGPFRVRAGSQLLTAPGLTVSATAAASRLGEAGEGPGSLLVDIEPRHPYVGQPVILRVRLVQRAQLAEDPQYVPPATPGFWSEPASRPESYYAEERGRRVLVTETRARLYPLAVGRATVGEAAATLAIAEAGSENASQWMGGQVPRREISVRSRPLEVDVRALPPGAPAGFSGAVGVFSVSWGMDRRRTSRDVPATARLEVRGVGNLPLVRLPELHSDDLEVFAGTVEDSLAIAGSDQEGRRRFQWTVLPRRKGRVRIAPPTFVWFDPMAGGYRQPALGAAELEVSAEMNATDGGREGLPRVFEDRPLDPFAHPAEPWAFGLAGLALGAAIALLRISTRPRPDASERATQREWLRAVGLGKGSDFWRAAEEASVWLEGRGRPVGPLRREISAARYGGLDADPSRIRSRLVEALSRAMPAASGPLPLRIAAAAMVVSAGVLCALFAPQRGDPSAAARAREADRAARAGDVDRGRREWTALWREGSRAPSLAARLAWSEVRLGRVAAASVWVLEGERSESRDPSLGWVADRVREGGGLIGATPSRLPVRRVEWAVAALLFAAAAGGSWSRRLPVALLLILSLTATLVAPFETWRARHLDRAVVRGPVLLEGAGVALEPGQVVRIVNRGRERVRVTAGPGLAGWVPGNAVFSLEDLR